MKKLFLLLLLTACSLEPRYRRPPTCPCPTWRVPADEINTCANIRFWETLSDPILDQLIYIALQNNRDLQVAAWRVIQFYGQYMEVRSAQFPQVNLQASALREKFPAIDRPPGVPTSITNIYSYAFTLSYELDLWGQLQSATHAACEQLLSEVENRRTVVLTLVSLVADSYITLRQLDRQLEISYQTLEARREAMQLARERFWGGLTSEIEVTQAISLFDEAQSAVVSLEEQIPRQENLISILIGMNPTAIWRGRAVDEFTMPDLVPAGLPSELLCRRPDILKAEHLLKATNAQIGVARAAFFPNFSLTGLFGGQSLELGKLFSKPAQMWQIGLNIAQPLFTGGQLTGQLIQAIAQNRESYFTYQQTVLTAFKEVNDALISHEQAKRQVFVQQDRVTDLKLYLELSWLRYYEGQTEYLTVLNAATDLFNEELSLAAAQGRVFTTLVEIYKAVGGGWVIDADNCLRKRASCY